MPREQIPCDHQNRTREERIDHDFAITEYAWIIVPGGPDDGEIWYHRSWGPYSGQPHDNGGQSVLPGMGA